MIMDLELLFADGTWAPTATGVNISPNVLDVSPLGTPIGPGSAANLGRDLGQGEPLWFVVTVKVAVTSSAAAEVNFNLRSAANAALTTTPIDLVSSGPIAKATLVAGYTFMVMLPSFAVGTTGWQRYVGANANITTTALTGGQFHIAILRNEQKNQKYGTGFTIDV
jgi:hypothetical protein